ncbi:DUF1780 domain-containing protein [Mesorhizobium sp. M0046]|uniref:DUF1780 domain-containing protein n=1 Tax=Mesorhizobium sp. M0046 TaxID=2956858 RepID=UPI0033366FEB
MSISEKEFSHRLSEEAQEAAELFSNAGQESQERTAVAGLLRVLGLDFQEDEIIKRGPEPIDVWFRDARFQVTEILDKGRPRNLEIKQRSERMKRAKRLDDLLERGTISSDPIPPEEFAALISERCAEKAEKYAGQCGDVDLAIYVNLRGRHLYPTEPFPPLKANLCRGWRSVTVITERFAVVLQATAKAPTFLGSRRGQMVYWDKMESVFPRLR